MANSPDHAVTEPAVRAVDVDGVGAVALGTVAWAIALGLCLIFRGRLADADSLWWTWVCLSGLVLGLLGLPYVIRRRSAYRSAESSDSAAASGSSSGTDPSTADS